MLKAMRETRGGAIAVRDDELCAAQGELAAREAIDAAPEGGATVAALERLVERGEMRREESVVLFNTGAGWLYR
jgi:threonine synthase